MQRWFIELNEAQLEQLPHEARELGTLMSGAAGERYLLFRDGFVALKVARKLGTKPRSGRMVEAGACRTTPLVHLDGDTVLVAESAES